MDTPIRMPFMERRKDNLHIQKQVQANGATAFAARSLVKLAAGVLTPCVTADVLCYGQAPGPSHASTEIVPQTLYGQNHWCFDPRDSQFILNITRAGGAVGSAGTVAFADAVTTNASPTVTSATAGFIASDVGKAISGTNIPPNTFIGVVNSATSIGLSSSATVNTPVNATGSGTVTATITGAAPPLSAVTIGSKYGILRDANGFQYVNLSDVTNQMFVAVALYPGQSLTDVNGLVLVEILPAAIQG
jgi:hypothetical protein